MGGVHLAEGAMHLDDAKRARVMVVCERYADAVASDEAVYALGGVAHPVQ